MENLVRPQPPAGLADRARSWVVWFGPARLVASAMATIIVCVGAFWLVRTPPPSTEAALPLTASPSTSVQATLPAPARGGSSTGGDVTVHVAGAVLRPGVHTLPAGARVTDAVAAAGGADLEADLDALNLASVLVDGARVYVPLVGEVVDAIPDGGPAPVAGPVDLNRATVGELDALPGVGPATAMAIVGDRNRNGPFLLVDDLERVPGIGPAKLEALRDLVTT